MSTSQTEWRSEILEMLDQAAAEYQFPSPGNTNFYFGAMRLTAFHSDSEWLIVFDLVVYDKGLCIFEKVVEAYGNKIREPGFQSAFEFSQMFSKAPKEPTELYIDGKCMIDKWSFSLPINGVVRSFKPSRTDYEAAGIDVDSPMPEEIQILRYLVYILGEELFETDELLLQICARGNAGLKRFIRLKEWRHPGPDPDEFPGETETFQSLAEALVTGNPTLYAASEKPNTHWSNWTDLEPWNN